MRLCILHNSGPGGAARLVNQIALGLAATDDVTVCTWGDTPVSTPPGVCAMWCRPPRIHLPAPFHPFANLVRSYLGSLGAAKRVDAGAFDVALVLACQWGQAPQALRRLRTPHIYFAQEGRRRTTESNYLPVASSARADHMIRSMGRLIYDGLGARLDRQAMRSASTIVANSAFTAHRLAQAYGVSAQVIELGVAVDQFRPGGHRSDKPGALVVGALDPTKGHELAVESLARLPMINRPTLRIVFNRGDESFGAHLTRLAQARGVKLNLLRNVSEAELVAEYQAATFLLALAQDEPFGLTVLEASACGTPTVAVGEGGYLRTVDPSLNGILAPRDPDAVARAVSEILTGLRAFDSQLMAAWTGEHWGWGRCISRLRAALVTESERGTDDGPEGRNPNPARAEASWTN
ncbi:MAG: glycosyltransferase family 4 protein [Acidimicrobiales bacterium]